MALTVFPKVRTDSLTAAVVVLLFVAVAGTTPLSAQEEPPAERLKVFLDCQTFGCDQDLTRREITWVDWVIDREDADVHLLVASARAGAGTVFDISFIGRGRFEGEESSLTHSSSSTDTQDERRRGLIERFKLGLVRYAGGTAAAEFLRVEYNVPGAASAAPVTPENDPWNLWVFAASVGGSARAQSLTSSTSVNGSGSASRTSETWKFRWGCPSELHRRRVRVLRRHDDHEPQTAFGDGRPPGPESGTALGRGGARVGHIVDVRQ